MYYFDKAAIEIIHNVVAKRWKEEGEPIPPFSTASEANLDALIKLPQSNFFGTEQYPTLASKAAIIFYTINKKHLFSNGNKRMSVTCLMVFLILNDKFIDVPPDEMTAKALWLANTTHTHNFEEIKFELENWIEANVIPLEEAEKSRGIKI